VVLLPPTFPQTPADGFDSRLPAAEARLLLLLGGACTSPRRMEVATSKAPAEATRALATAFFSNPISHNALCCAAHGEATCAWVGCPPAGGPRPRVEARVVYPDSISTCFCQTLSQCSTTTGPLLTSTLNLDQMVQISTLCTNNLTFPTCFRPQLVDRLCALEKLGPPAVMAMCTCILHLPLRTGIPSAVAAPTFLHVPVYPSRCRGGEETGSEGGKEPEVCSNDQ